MNTDLGSRAEAAAAAYLEAHGWHIIARNWRFGHKEIDLIAARAAVVAFVEVKARSSRSWGHPLDAITRSKRRDLEVAARAWVARHAPSDPMTEYRFDAIWVLAHAGEVRRIEHVPGAWRL
jgi:putative endonuclease